MRYVRHLLIASLALIVLVAMAGLVSAGTPLYAVTITSVSCDEIMFEYVLNYGSTGGADFAEYVVAVDGTTVDSNAEISPWDGSYTVVLDLAPRPAPYFIDVTVSIPQYATDTDTAQVLCEEDPVDPVDPEEPEEPAEIATGQICFGRGAAAATVFFSGSRIDVYAINPQDNGEMVMSFTQEYLRTLPASDEALLLGDSDIYIPIEFYRNLNGLYRMVAGPDAEGKFFECTFGGACAHERTWIGEANAPTDEVVPVCSAPVVPTAAPTAFPTAEPTAEPTVSPTTTPLPTR